MSLSIQTLRTFKVTPLIRQLIQGFMLFLMAFIGLNLLEPE